MGVLGIEVESPRYRLKGERSGAGMGKKRDWWRVKVKTYSEFALQPMMKKKIRTVDVSPDFN